MLVKLTLGRAKSLDESTKVGIGQVRLGLAIFIYCHNVNNFSRGKQMPKSFIKAEVLDRRSAERVLGVRKFHKN